MRLALTVLIVISVVLGALGQSRPAQPASGDDALRLPEEKHLRNVRQLSFGGENAEAYFTELQNANC